MPPSSNKSNRSNRSKESNRLNELNELNGLNDRNITHDNNNQNSYEDNHHMMYDEIGNRCDFTIDQMDNYYDESAQTQAQGYDAMLNTEDYINEYAYISQPNKKKSNRNKHSYDNFNNNSKKYNDNNNQRGGYDDNQRGRYDDNQRGGYDDTNIMRESIDDAYKNTYDILHQNPYEVHEDVLREHGGEKRMVTKQSYDKYIGRVRYEQEAVDLGDNTIPIHREIILDEKNIPDLSKIQPDPVTREDVDYPRFSLGFNHWIHASKNKTEVFNTFAGKKRVYLVVNGYERYVDDYDESIGNISDTFFNLESSNKDARPKILSRAFYKLWEIIFYFDLISTTDNFVSAHLAEGPGSFIQATMFFRDMFAKNSKNDAYHAITIHSETEDTSLDLEEKFVDYYSREKPQRFFMHKTYNAQTAGASKTKDNGDLTKMKTIANFKKEIGTKVDLVTGDGGFDWNNENIQEQECAYLIYAQILTALNIQKKGGHFVLKMFETFTKISMKMILILKYFYTDVHIIKPFTSRESNSERYVVCKSFKYDESKISDILQKMMNGFDAIGSKTSSKPDRNVYLCDIFPSIDVPDELLINMMSINIAITNQQFCVVNKMIEYINGSNFHGEMYMQYKFRQMRLSKYWIETFMSDNKNYSDVATKIQKLIETANKSQKSEYARLKNNLIGYDVKKDIVKVESKVESKEIKKNDSKQNTQPKLSRSKRKTSSKTKAKTNSKTKAKTNNKTKAKTKSKTKAKTNSKIKTKSTKTMKK
jgi:23S rRNA U2552 (ribose-2'-O)-methylase RlmE/FtsJ